MGREGLDTQVSPTERTVPNDPERTIATPRFDDKSIQGARPAVPLTLRGKAQTWPLAVIAACVLAGLAGGLLGGVALMKYQAGRAEPASDSRQTTPARDSAAAGHEDSQPRPAAGSQPATNQPTADTQPAADPQAAAQSQPQTRTEDESGDDTRAGVVDAEPETRTELRAALDGWVAATNARDVSRHMTYYAQTVGAFYLSRNASREAVRAEKTRLFERARAVDVRASEPDIRLSRDGRTAVMRFRKRYRIDERGGEVLQELRWRRTPSGWRIVSERDLRVIQ